MEAIKLSQDEWDAIYQRSQQSFQASVAKANNGAPVRLQPITIPLDTAQLSTSPFVVSFPFNSIRVQDATDSTVKINVKFDTQDQFQGALVLKQNDTISFPGDGVAKCFIDWAAQAGKSITLVFGIGFQFQSGTMISVNSGGVSVNEGSSAALSKVTLASGVAAAIAAQNLNRKCGTLQNKTGASIFIGPDATVTDDSGANPGIEYAPGERIFWKNTAALYGYSAGGGVVALIEET